MAEFRVPTDQGDVLIQTPRPPKDAADRDAMIRSALDAGQFTPADQPSLYQRAARSAANLAGEMVVGGPNAPLPGGLHYPGMTDIAQSGMRFAIPQTETQLGTAIGASVMPGGPVARIIGGALGGGTGATIEGRSPIGGAIEGGLGVALSEGGGAVAGKLARSIPGARRQINFTDAAKTAEIIGDLVPALREIAKTPEGLKRAAIGAVVKGDKTALNLIGDRYVEKLTEVGHMIHNNKLTLPTLAEQIPVTPTPPLYGPTGRLLTTSTPAPTYKLMTLTEAVDKLKDLGYAGYAGTKDNPATRTIQGLSSRELWQGALDDIKRELMKFNPTGEAVIAFEAARTEWALGRSFLALLRNPGTFRGVPDGVEFNMNGLREAFERSFYKFQRSLMSSDLDRFSTVLYRGAPIGSVDILPPGAGRVTDALTNVFGRGAGGSPSALSVPLRTILPNIGAQYTGRPPLSLPPGAQRTGNAIFAPGAAEYLRSLGTPVAPEQP